MKTPPKEIIAAASAMLAPYFDGLTAEKLVRGLIHETAKPTATAPAAGSTGGGELLTVKEFCRRAKISRYCVWTLRQAKRLRTVKIGRAVRIPEAEAIRLAAGEV